MVANLSSILERIFLMFALGFTAPAIQPFILETVLLLFAKVFIVSWEKSLYALNSAASPYIRNVVSLRMLSGYPTRARVSPRQIPRNSSVTNLAPTAPFCHRAESAPSFSAKRLNALSTSITSITWVPLAS